MKFERTKNSTRNLIFGILEKIVTILFPFITRTLIIYKLGSEYLGLTSLFTSVLSILSLSELGIGTAISFCIYEPIAKDDTKTINKYLYLIKKVYKYVGIFILVVGAALSPFLKFIIKNDTQVNINIYILYFIYLLNSAISYLFYAYKGTIYNAYQRKDILHKIRILAEIIKYVIQIIVLLLFPNYYIYVLALLVSSFVDTIIIGIKSKKDYPLLDASEKADLSIINNVKKKASYIFACSVCSKLVNSIDNIVISSSIGLTILGIYGNYNYISTSVLGFITIAYQSIISSIGNALITENREKNIKLHNILKFGVKWLTIWCSICLVCLFQPFIKIWVGDMYALPIETVVLICVFFYANANAQFYSTSYVSATGLWNITLKYRIFASVVNLVLDIVLVRYLGINGILIGSVVAYLLISWPVHIGVTYKYILKLPVIDSIKEYLCNIVLTICSCVAFYFLLTLIEDTGIISFIIKLCICVIIPNLLFILFNRNNENFRGIILYVKNLFRRNK